ncbi:carboxymuconolactone decarboxylase family protein [Halomonas binhaiensis]|uniref:Carboxymuconolactone decarboxylase family protein n=1 Tax=Halomonas binhaiensis TaxID=2562282 RepID=A0A5C1NLU4_9GAMM|nr:carboxymuconolactone decarboxylase family protein [Halomonas binhaiensis]QEM83543.1 carboxymuconolactone decarboxylase family protein [Halomonas binhaiensis]
MPQNNNLTLRGRNIMNQLEPGLADKLTNSLKELDEDLPSIITDFVFGAVVGRKGLDIKIREMLTVASLVSLGNAHDQLELHMKGALNVGVTPQDLLEVVIQMSVYAGFPAFLNGLTAYRAALAATGHALPAASGLK